MSKCIVKAILAKKNPKMCYTYNVERCLDIKCVFNCIAKATYLKKNQNIFKFGVEGVQRLWCLTIASEYERPHASNIYKVKMDRNINAQQLALAYIL